MLFKSTEIVNSVFEWIVFSFFLSELIVNRILIVFLNKIVYYLKKKKGKKKKEKIFSIEIVVNSAYCLLVRGTCKLTGDVC